ncbi:DUF5661 family protein [Flavobacterium sp. GT3R68]|uniref:DUF5661 family protein n=1 Tax=Flavobacterium sp. GT3R68 TaxID=2594437 RepID=UPI000F8616E0|nr:DUF5661 family protein [Flavobacterium sp. GT3R68]RTY89126.1 hypothetical protein EKL32_24190 [Flavobacterium sp. GSN2]TRW90076.1 hypothetical protein FNW07_11500 [Flavobacterium sp. GT3R68]
MAKNDGTYQDVYIKRDGKFISLRNDVTEFCEKYIKPVHKVNWDWSERDFENPKNDPTIEEARVIRNVIFKDLNDKKETEVNLSTINNVEALKAYFNPKSKHEEFNMNEFAFALKVELEHGKLKAANVTNNHPFLTAMIVLAHMTETLSYYKRLQIMEAEGEIYEILRKMDKSGSQKEKWHKALIKTETKLIEFKKELAERLDKMDDIPALEEIGD